MQCYRDDSVCDIDLTDPQEYTASIETGHSHARADWGPRLYMLSMYNPRYRNAWLNRDIALRLNAAALGMSRCIARYRNVSVWSLWTWKLSIKCRAMPIDNIIVNYISTKSIWKFSNRTRNVWIQRIAHVIVSWLT